MKDDPWKTSPPGETGPTGSLAITVSKQGYPAQWPALGILQTGHHPQLVLPDTLLTPVLPKTHSSQGTCGAVAPYSFDQFKKTTNHASRHVMGCAQLPRTLLGNFRQLWDGELSTLLTPMATSPTQLSSEWQTIPHTPTLAPTTSQRQPQIYSKVGM